MDSLRLLVIQNQSALDKLRARAQYCRRAVLTVENDVHKQYGPYAGFWDEWYIEALDMESLLAENLPATILFLTELRDFVASLEAKKRLSKSDQAYLLEVTSLTSDKLLEQTTILSELDERIALHRQITRQLLLVEAIDGLEE